MVSGEESIAEYSRRYFRCEIYLLSSEHVGYLCLLHILLCPCNGYSIWFVSAISEFRFSFSLRYMHWKRHGLCDMFFEGGYLRNFMPAD